MLSGPFAAQQLASVGSSTDRKGAARDLRELILQACCRQNCWIMDKLYPKSFKIWMQRWWLEPEMERKMLSWRSKQTNAKPGSMKGWGNTAFPGPLYLTISLQFEVQHLKGTQQHRGLLGQSYKILFKEKKGKLLLLCWMHNHRGKTAQ